MPKTAAIRQPDAASPDRALRVAAWAIVAAYALAFLVASRTGRWLHDAAGREIASDFIAIWSAGRLALAGTAGAAYDWAVHAAVQTQAVGYELDGYFAWLYPPTFLLVAAALALLPHLVAQLAWSLGTLPLFLATIRAIAPAPGAMILALAFPACAWNFGYGQSGFLIAALVGGGLALVDRRPIVAGVLFGLLTIKPQFGLLIPVALLAGGHWRAIASATATALAMAAVATLVFGPEVWSAFLASSEAASRAALGEGRANFAELVTAFGAIRWAGGSLTLAWAAQAAIIVALALAVWRAWSRNHPPKLKCALVAAGALVASPYAYIYDLITLAVAIAFLAARGASPLERALIGVVCLLTLGGPQTGLPVAALAAPIVAGMAINRLFVARTAGADLIPG